MKKILSLSLVALFAVSALAQQPTKAEQLKPVQFNANAQRVQKEAILENVTPVELTLPSRKAKAALTENEAVDTLCYDRPDGAFFAGITGDLNMFYPRIICDTVDTMTFYNTSLKHTADSLFWILESSSGTYVDTTWNLELDPLPESFYYYPMPSLVTVDSAYEIVTSYQYGSADADNAHVLAKPDFTMPLTTCAMYTDTLVRSTGRDWYAVSAPSKYGKYIYGSNLNVGSLWGKSSILVDSIVTVWDNLTTLYADSAFLTIYSNDVTTAAEAIPAGATIKLELFPLGVNAQGKLVIDWNNPITSASATNENAYVYPYTDGSGFIGSLNFAFGKKNALGGFTPEPIYIKGLFVTVLSGISSNGCDFGIFSDYYYDYGQSYCVANGGIYNFWNSNILLSINSKFVADAPEGVEETSNDVKPIKVIRDGQILIQKGEKTFTVMGTEF